VTRTDSGAGRRLRSAWGEPGGGGEGGRFPDLMVTRPAVKGVRSGPDRYRRAEPGRMVKQKEWNELQSGVKKKKRTGQDSGVFRSRGKRGSSGYAKAFKVDNHNSTTLELAAEEPGILQGSKKKGVGSGRKTDGVLRGGGKLGCDQMLPRSRKLRGNRRATKTWHKKGEIAEDLAGTLIQFHHGRGRTCPAKPGRATCQGRGPPKGNCPQGGHGGKGADQNGDTNRGWSLGGKKHGGPMPT